MAEYLSVRWKGPLMALQGPRIDGLPQAVPIPTLAALTGLLGAALGIARRETEVLQSIQDTMRLAVIVHAAGVEIIDYQTADLSKRHMRGPMWSSDGHVVKREGSVTTGTRQQFRPYRSDADMTCIIELLEGAPYAASTILTALDYPARPLFLGRTTCPPETALAGKLILASSLQEAVQTSLSGTHVIHVYLPMESADIAWGDIPVSIPGTRDWAAQRHSGSQTYVIREMPRDHPDGTAP